MNYVYEKGKGWVPGVDKHPKVLIQNDQYAIIYTKDCPDDVWRSSSDDFDKHGDLNTLLLWFSRLNRTYIRGRFHRNGSEPYYNWVCAIDIKDAERLPL